MRAFALLIAGTMVFLAGCGYVGPVLPPSPRLPIAITDLTAIEVGDQLVINFTTPIRTTDNLPVRRFSDIDLRIGAATVPFDFERWAASATKYDVAPPPPSDPDNPVAAALSKKLPVAQWLGKHIAVAVRTTERKSDHYSSWSNRVVLTVVPPLAPPVIKADATAKGVSVSWADGGSGVEHRIYRRGPGDNAPVEIGTSKTNDFIDSTSQFDTHYEYTAAAVDGLAESLPSQPVGITPQDKFPPAVPSGIAALAAPGSVEISWMRSPESDLKGYFIYRSVDGGPFQAIGGLLTVPTFSDHDVQHGKSYRYQVSAVDLKNNGSDKSAPVEIHF